MTTAHLTQEEFRENFNPAQSRIQILSAPINLPGTCVLCGTSRTDDRQYVDLGIWVEFVGQIYFCTYCMTEMVNRLGGHTAEQAAAIETELNAARQTIIDFHVKEQALDGAINSLAASGLFTGFNSIATNSPESVPNEQDQLSYSGITEEDKQRAIEQLNGTAESSSEQRSNDVPATSNDELDVSNWL